MKVYTYKNCDTCRKAVQWLKAKKLAFEEVPIRETPPAPAELSKMLDVYEGNLRRLFNTSGRDYKELKIGEKLPGMSREEAIRLLASNGNLVKRPFVLTKGSGLVGFKEEEWAKQL